MNTQYGSELVAAPISFPISFVRCTETFDYCLFMGSPLVTRFPGVQERVGLGSYENEDTQTGLISFVFPYNSRHSRKGLGMVK